MNKGTRMGTLSHTQPDARTAASCRDGFSLVEVVVAMVMLSVVISSLAMLTTVTAQRSIGLANETARQAYALQETNRYTAMAYDSLAGKVGCDTAITGNLSYLRCMSLTSGSRYKEVTVVVTPLRTGTYADTVVFRRVTSTTTNPLFMP